MKTLLIVLALLVPSIALAQLNQVPIQHSTAYEKNHVFTGLKIQNLTISFHTAAYRTLMIFDAAAVPSDGALSAANLASLAYCYEGISQSTDPTESAKALSFVGSGAMFTTGVAVAVSTSTAGCATLTSDGNNDWFSGQVLP